jgi:hypothetical protein
MIAGIAVLALIITLIILCITGDNDNDDGW